MVKKFINIDETVARVMEAVARCPPGLTPEQHAIMDPQLRTDRIAGEMARFLMEESNLGTEPYLILNALIVVSAQSMFQNISTTEECDNPIYPDDPVHSMVHQTISAFAHALHLALAQARGIHVDGVHEATEPVIFDTKEVGDA